MLSREDFLNKAMNDVIEVDVPELGGTVFLRKFDLKGLVALSKFDGDEVESTLGVLALSLCDAEGTPLFAFEERHLLAKHSGKLINRLATSAIRHNGIAPDQIEQAPKA